MKPIRAMPGVGGSLGECGICGESLTLEILLNENVEVLGHPDLAQDFPVHKQCGKLLREIQRAQDWNRLPQGPLRDLLQELGQIQP
jgi:hypothetical protein